MIICIDTSGSMKGINEYIAKATMFKMVMQVLYLKIEMLILLISALRYIHANLLKKMELKI
ncbi:hypothetical protein OFP60_02990 [Brachyspira hyodysenteriae]|nr:hypothetical protein [Brachyspira hyodysenteriae]MCZ9894038.1 hypothetical protein [Brachyspira hyodysenteriae]